MGPPTAGGILRQIEVCPKGALTDDSRSCPQPPCAATFIVQHMERRQADVGDWFFIHHLLGDQRRCGRILIYIADCSRRAGSKRKMTGRQHLEQAPLWFAVSVDLLLSCAT